MDRGRGHDDRFRGAALVGALALLLANAIPVAVAQVAASDIVLVDYHVSPDPRAGSADADPFSSTTRPDAPFPTGALPATRVDGVLLAAAAPEGDPSNPAAHTRELQNLLKERAATGAPVRLDITGTTTSVEAVVTPTANVSRVVVHAAVVKDGAFAKSRVERDLAVATLPSRSVDLATGSPRSIAWERNASDGGTGVAVWVELVDDAGTHRAGEVVQAALWTGAPVHRITKGILIEHLTATWCEPCGPSDAAVALVVGAPPSVAFTASYLVAPSAWTFAGAGIGIAAAVWLLRRSAP